MIHILTSIILYGSGPMVLVAYVMLRAYIKNARKQARKSKALTKTEGDKQLDKFVRVAISQKTAPFSKGRLLWNNNKPQ